MFVTLYVSEAGIDFHEWKIVVELTGDLILQHILIKLSIKRTETNNQPAMAAVFSNMF